MVVNQFLLLGSNDQNCVTLLYTVYPAIHDGSTMTGTGNKTYSITWANSHN